MSTTTNKRNPYDGFDKTSMPNRISLNNRYSASWRRVEQRKLVATTIHQTFTHISGKHCTLEHLCPWGMREYMTKLLLHDKCKNLNVLPMKLKEEFPELIGVDYYDRNQWEISIKHSGPSESKLHYGLFCNHC